jgi:hypothetical protein
MKMVTWGFLISVFSLMLSPSTAFSQYSDDNPYAWILQKNPRPYIVLTYGIDQPRHKNLAADFPSVGSFELRGGYHYIDTLNGGILSEVEAGFFGSWYNPKLGESPGTPSDFKGKLGRFGFGNGQGYGYDLQGLVLVPYSVSNASWTKLTTERPTNLSQSDADILDRYEGTFRFGLSAESGIRADFAGGFSLSGAYEVNVIYPRFVFWEWLGSSAVAGGANKIVMFFGDKLLDSSPTIAPIVILVLKSAVAWGIYQLWREEMNWPFDSETPLTHETLKFSLAFNF